MWNDCGSLFSALPGQARWVGSPGTLDKASTRRGWAGYPACMPGAEWTESEEAFALIRPIVSLSAK